MTTESQNNRIYQWMLDGNSITTLEAMLKFRIGRLASRIWDISSEYAVPVERTTEPNADGKGYHTRYSISAEIRERLKDVPLCNVERTLYGNRVINFN